MTIDLNGFPVLEGIFLWIILVLFTFGFGFGYYAYYRQKSGNPIKGVTVSGFAPDGSLLWIGCQGSGLNIKIETRDDAIRVRWALVNYLFVIIAMFVFGPGLTMMFILFPEKISKGVPVPVWIMVGCFMLVAYVVFANQLRKYLFEEPMFDVTIEGIKLLKGGAEIEQIRARDIKNLTIEKSSFQSTSSKGRRGRWIDNFTLLVNTEDSNVRRLCITDNKKQIEQLKSQMETRLRLMTDLASPASA